jgi:hypothetical protein
MRTVMVLLAIVGTAATGAAQPITQKLGKEATKGAASAAKEQGLEVGKSSRDVVGAAVDALTSRREKVQMLSNDIGREVARGAVVAAAGAIKKACGQDEHCLRNEAHDVGYALGEGVAQGLSAKLSIVPSMLGFALGFVFAAVLAGLTYLLMSHRKQQPTAPLVPRTSH